VTLPPQLRGLRAAFFFLTRIPAGGWPYSDDDWRWSTAWFPLVGAFLGLAYAGIWQVTRPAGPFVAALLVVSAGLLLTGYFHEDGLADTADALGGGSTPQRILEILKDSRVGAFGSAALTMVLILRAALLAQLDARAPLALILSQCVARLPPIALMVLLPYATDDAVAKSKQVTRATSAQLVFAALIATAVTFGVYFVSPDGIWLGLGIAATITVILGLRFKARAGGITGDFLGATEQLCECAILLGLALS
jgi:adenosylcobinamide-GDP ribazoletransferase